jgi:hypothetical protein
VRRILLALVAGAGLVGLMAPNAAAHPDTPMGAPDTSGPATAQDYEELMAAFAEVKTSLAEFETVVAGDRRRWNHDCRGYTPAKTVRCAAVKFQPEGGMAKALSVWRCESGWGTEPPHSDAYHGPFQYLYSTYDSQQDSMPNVVRWYDLSASVHDMRSNMLTAVAWAARHGWGPWSCA